MSLYHEAAEILTSPSTQGGSLKSRIFNKKNKNVKSPPAQLYALVLETSRWSGILKELIERAEILKLEKKLSPALALLLTHDLLLAKGGVALPQSHGLRASIERHKARLSSELKLARLRRKVSTTEELREQVRRESAGEEQRYPRWVRINTLKTSLEDMLSTTFKGYHHTQSISDVITKPGKQLLIDPHVPNLVAITQGVDLSKTDAYTDGKIIFQDKASCFPAYLLDPRGEDGDVVDACAAPGNKTTHLAAITHAHRPEFETQAQTIYAFEKDQRRAQTLEKMVRIAGSKKMTRIGLGQDFLQVDPHDERYRRVGALLLDPSCSGSGIVGRDSMPEVHLPDPAFAPPQNGTSKARQKPKSATDMAAEGQKETKKKRKHEEMERDGGRSDKVLVDDDGNETVVTSEKALEARLEALASFQLTLLLHAFRFPAARKITYSTCSVHAEENEKVVLQALGSEVARERRWRILKRSDQVTGMREWPVRGVVEACQGDEEVAEGCIRSYKDDGLGVMGFFVAGFVREGKEGGGDGGDGDGPYVRDEEGRIVRDVMGMPVLKETGEAVALNAAESSENDSMEGSGSHLETDDDDDDGDDDEASSSEEGEDEEEWNGFAN